MDRKQLLKLMPADKNDAEAAEKLVSLGYAELKPVIRDMLLFLRVHDSPVSDVFCNFFARTGEFPLPDVKSNSEPLVLEINNILARHETQEGLRRTILVDILPFWTVENLVHTSHLLSMIATWPDCLNSDLHAARLLIRHRFADRQWIAGWLEFKKNRLDERAALIEELKTELSR